MPWRPTFPATTGLPFDNIGWAELTAHDQVLGYVFCAAEWATIRASGHLWWRTFEEPQLILEGAEFIVSRDGLLLEQRGLCGRMEEFADLLDGRYPLDTARLRGYGHDIPFTHPRTQTTVRWLPGTEFERLEARRSTTPAS